MLTKVRHCRWAKDQVGKVAHDITTGNVQTRDEHDAEQAVLGVPTFGDALEQYIEHRTQPPIPTMASMPPERRPKNCWFFLFCLVQSSTCSAASA